MTHLWKSDKVAFGELLLDDFHQVLGKSSAKNGSAFPTFSTTPAPATIFTTLQTPSKTRRHNYRVRCIEHVTRN